MNSNMNNEKDIQFAAAVAASKKKKVDFAKLSKQNEIFGKAKAALFAIFTQLPAGPQAQFRPVEDAIVSAAQNNNWALAAEILSTAVVPTELAAAQSAMVTALTPYLALVATLGGATTVDEVNAITVP